MSSTVKRLKSLIKANMNEQSRKSDFSHPLKNCQVGDSVRVDQVFHAVTGVVECSDSFSNITRYMYYLTSGTERLCLIIEKGVVCRCILTSYVEGFLDKLDNVPTILGVSGVNYRLSNHSYCVVETSGTTDFNDTSDIAYWNYQNESGEHFILHWQDGKFFAYKGNDVPQDDILTFKF